MHFIRFCCSVYIQILFKILFLLPNDIDPNTVQTFNILQEYISDESESIVKIMQTRVEWQGTQDICHIVI